MCDAGHDLGLNILLDIGPWLAFNGGLAWQQLPQVAWLNLGDDIPLTEVVIVVDDYFALVSKDVAHPGEG